MIPLIGRSSCLDQVQALLEPQAKAWLLAFYGLSGIGKTALLNHLHNIHQEEIVIIWLDFDIKAHRDYFDSVLTELENGLRQCDLPSLAWTAYEERRQEIRTQAANRRLMVSQQNLAVGGATIANSPQTMVVHMDEGLARIELEAGRSWTQAFLQLASYLNEPVLLLIDNWDALVQRGSPDLCIWFGQEVLLALHRQVPLFRVVVAGDRPFRESGLDEGVVNIELPALTSAQAGQLMRQQDLTDDMLITAIYERTEGNPLLINLALTLWQENPDLDLTGLVEGWSVHAASEWLLGRILDNLSEPRSQIAIQRGAILRSWTLDILEAICQRDDFDLDWYRQFALYPFVQEVANRPGLYTFVRTVREVQIGQLWRNRRRWFHQTHGRALAWYTGAYRHQ
jgi:hypothetical protein